jgi:hypothetical protein
MPTHRSNKLDDFSVAENTAKTNTRYEYGRYSRVSEISGQ